MADIEPGSSMNVPATGGDCPDESTGATWEIINSDGAHMQPPDWGVAASQTAGQATITVPNDNDLHLGNPYIFRLALAGGGCLSGVFNVAAP